MLQDIKLPRLDAYTQLVDEGDIATITFSQWWDQVATQLEDGINGINQALNAAAAAQTTANGAQTTADGAQASANVAQTTADGAQTSANNAQSTADNAYTLASTAVQQDQTSAPAYSTYGGQTVSAAYVQAEAQTTDNAIKSASAALHSLITKLQAVNVLT